MGLPVIPIAVEILRRVGPTILRKFGKARGGSTEDVADVIANVVEGVSGEPEDKQQAAIAEALRGLDPEQARAFAQLQVDLARIKEEGAWKELEIELEAVKGDTQARTAELHQTDIYTKQTRPRIARQSWYIAAAYALTCNVVIPLHTAMTGGSEYATDLTFPFSWEVFIALAAPALTYMGVRGFEKWKHGSKVP